MTNTTDDFDARRDGVVEAGLAELAQRRAHTSRRYCQGCDGKGWQFIQAQAEVAYWLQTICAACRGTGRA